jgi:hypothetical protein
MMMIVQQHLLRVLFVSLLLLQCTNILPYTSHQQNGILMVQSWTNIVISKGIVTKCQQQHPLLKLIRHNEFTSRSSSRRGTTISSLKQQQQQMMMMSDTNNNNESTNQEQQEIVTMMDDNNNNNMKQTITTIDPAIDNNTTTTAIPIKTQQQASSSNTNKNVDVNEHDAAVFNRLLRPYQFGELIQTLIGRMILLFVAFGFLLQFFGYSYIIEYDNTNTNDNDTTTTTNPIQQQPRKSPPKLRIGTIEERDFLQEIRRDMKSRD